MEIGKNGSEKFFKLRMGIIKIEVEIIMWMNVEIIIGKGVSKNRSGNQKKRQRDWKVVKVEWEIKVKEKIRKSRNGTGSGNRKNWKLQ